MFRVMRLRRMPRPLMCALVLAAAGELPLIVGCHYFRASSVAFMDDLAPLRWGFFVRPIRTF